MARIARHPATWIAGGVVVAFALRAAWLDAPLGRDEGGDAYIALAWHHSGPFAYGPYFLDRPPLLVALYRAAVLFHGALGIRILGALAAGTAVALATLLAVRVGGRRAAPGAALVGAVLVSSYALMAVYTPAELLAIVPSTASVLCLVIGLERRPGGRWQLAAAGLLAGLALMVKQSFGDALFAGVVALVAVGLSRRAHGRDLLLRAGSYAAGLGVVVVALVAWEQLARTPDESVYFALIGFRLDAASALASGDLAQHASQLVQPALESGLALGLGLAVVGLASLRRERPIALVALGAWLAAGMVGIALGGSYWPHYLIEVVPVTAVGAGIAFARWRRAGALAAAAVALPALAFTLSAVNREMPERYQASAVAVGDYVRARARPDETVYVMYARTNVLWYSGLRDPFPYDWSLMMRAVPGAQHRLRALLASPQRPTWVVVWQSPHAFRLDRSGATERLLERHYRDAGTVCGHRILLERGAKARRAPAIPPTCAVKT